MMITNTPYIYAFADEADCFVDGQIKAMLRNHLDGIEIRNVDGTSVSDITVEKAKEVKKALDDNGLSVWSVGSPIGKISIEDDFEQHFDKYKHTLEIAKVLSAENMRLFSFYIPRGKTPEDYKSKVIERMGQFVEAAKDYHICLCHENEKGIYGDVAKRCVDLHLALPEIKGIFDPANFVQCAQDTIEAWELLKSYTKYLHIKDAKADGIVVPAGYGTGNVPHIISSFISQGGTALTIEPHLTIFDGLSSLEREGEESNIGEFVYADNNIAFDAACKAVRDILTAMK